MKWNKEDIEYLKRNINYLSNKALASELKCTISQVKGALKRYGIKRDPNISKGIHYPNTWKPRDWAFVVNHFIIMNPKELSNYVPHSPNAIQQKINKAGLLLPKNIRNYRDREAQFQKGQIPWNKGLKGLRLSPRTEFKKGHKPWNTKYDGYISIRDLNRTPYKYIRLKSGQWVLYHRWLWEQYYGSIPPGYIVTFKNGDTMDIRIENLELISRGQNAIRNINTEKASQTLKRVWAEGRFNMSDKFIANIMARENIELKEELLKYKEILELKRLQIKLKQILREVES